MLEVLAAIVQEATLYKDHIAPSGPSSILLNKYWQHLHANCPQAAICIVDMILDPMEDYGTVMLSLFANMLKGTKVTYT